MTHILHLSDLHLDPLASPTQPTLLANLGQALEAEHAKLPKDARFLALITGDLFQTSTIPPSAALESFGDLLAHLHRAFGADIPVLLVPGNHDCRRSGVIGPHDAHLFEAVRAAFPAVLSIPRGQRLARIDLAPFDLPLTLAAMDTTVLPRGKLSAGGTLPHLELLEQWRSLADPDSEGPLVVAAHHHLIPTPVTDLSEIDSSRESALFRFLLRRVAPDLVANANFEELLQTALGAGTTLTTLQHLGRPVLFLHGHKHYPAARLVRAIRQGESDVALLAAGSAGTIERLGMRPSAGIEAELPAQRTSLWPSFNVVRLDPERVAVETVRFCPWPLEPGAHGPRTARIRLFEAQCSPRGFEPELLPASSAPVGKALTLRQNCAEFTVIERPGCSRHDLDCQRLVQPTAAMPGVDFVELIKGPSDAQVQSPTSVHDVPVTLPLQPGGDLEYRLGYRVLRGVCGTLAEAHRVYGPHVTHEYVGLLVRRSSGTARLALRGVPVDRVFGSVTDLGTGIEQPLPLQAAAGGGVLIEVARCPARSRLRLYWPLTAT